MSDNHPQLLGLSGQPSSVRTSATNLGRSTSVTNAGTSGEVQHVSFLSEHIGSLYLDEGYSDVRLLVEDTAFPAHRVILAARSEYFRAMLYGGMRETMEDEVELLETTVGSFRALLKYIYTGKISLSNLKEE
uniref:BTB domain-containing protein n=1 Tax=Plectus sambesii TaxID=2011161 RepID=A0A914WNW1_9BILA